MPSICECGVRSVCTYCACGNALCDVYTVQCEVHAMKRKFDQNGP